MKYYNKVLISMIMIDSVLMNNILAGLIRGIDFQHGLLYILTPTQIDKLSLVDTLVYSDWMPELRGLENDLPGGTPIPYRSANTTPRHRKLMFPPRRRFNPLQLLKMSRNS